MKDIKRNKGSVTIEAAISFMVFLFFILFFLSFGKVYQVQNILSHATLQSAKSISYESIYMETSSGSKPATLAEDIQYVCDLVEMFGGPQYDLPDKLFQSFQSDDFNDEAHIKETFKKYIVAEDVDEYLKKLGIEKGFDGIDFEVAEIGEEDVSIRVRYKVKISLPIFGDREIELVQASKVKLMKGK